MVSKQWIILDAIRNSSMCELFYEGYGIPASYKKELAKWKKNPVWKTLMSLGEEKVLRIRREMVKNNLDYRNPAVVAHYLKKSETYTVYKVQEITKTYYIKNIRAKNEKEAIEKVKNSKNWKSSYPFLESESIRAEKE